MPSMNHSLSPNQDMAIVPQLTEREQEVLRLLTQGCSNSEIAGELYLSTNTVKTHIRSILNKFGVDRRIQAVVYALKSGLV